MKFLAILGDSVREALDAKVIYVLFGLSALVILFAVSVSFTPEPAEEGLQTILGNFEGSRPQFGFPAMVSYAAEDLTRTNQASRVWDSEYRYTLVVTDKVRDGGKPFGQKAKGAEDGPDEWEGPEKEKAKKEAKGKPDGAKKGPEPSAFKLLVLFRLLLRTPEGELTDEDREARDRLRELFMEGARRKEGKKESGARFVREVERVNTPQMERFVRTELGEKGALEVTALRLESQTGHEYRFAVECKAREGTYRTWPHEVRMLFGLVPLGNWGVGNFVYLVEDQVVGGWGAALVMLLGSVITAFFIPNMLRKGTIDLLLAKPIHRSTLLVFKFIGGLSFVFINLVVVVVGVWLVLGVRSGLWSGGFLLTIFVLTFQFAIFYAVSTLLGVLTRSPIVCILLCCFTWLVLWAVGIGAMILKPLSELGTVPGWTYTSVNTARLVLPRYKDLDLLNSQLLAHDLLDRESSGLRRADETVTAMGLTWWETVGVTTLQIGLLLGLACWRFSVKDY